MNGGVGFRILRRAILHIALLVVIGTIVLFLELDARDYLGGILLMLTFVAATGGIPFAVIVLGLRMRRFGRLAYALFLYAWVIGCAYAGGRIQAIQYNRSTATGTKIARALESFYEKNGAFPQKLEALVPGQLAVIPTTAMGFVTTTPFQYRLNPDGSYELTFHNRGFATATYFPQFDSWGHGDE